MHFDTKSKYKISSYAAYSFAYVFRQISFRDNEKVNIHFLDDHDINNWIQHAAVLENIQCNVNKRS